MTSLKQACCLTSQSKRLGHLPELNVQIENDEDVHAFHMTGDYLFAVKFHFVSLSSLPLCVTAPKGEISSIFTTLSPKNFSLLFFQQKIDTFLRRFL